MTQVSAPHHWTLDDLPWHTFDAGKVDADLLKVIKAAAMVERNGSDYGRYLTNVFSDDPAFCEIAQTWAVEEEQHGMALGRWAELADSNFKFDDAFAQFLEMYRIPVDATASVRGSRAGELCARCVVETGTSSFYSALRDAVDEPLLKAICAKIAADEFRHYKLFYTHMERYLVTESIPFWGRLKVAVGRLQEADDDELATAYFAGNGMTEAYDRKACASAYSERAFGYYRERHTKRAGFMIAQAVGFNPEGLLGKLIQKMLWLVIGFSGRKFRPV
ncbi:MAG: ferritin-like domain-containing protein [Rhodospirillaceae bacterium]|nr:ferritin-like domain-containing protein [Rhodospirillaceae bacterium]